MKLRLKLLPLIPRLVQNLNSLRDDVEPFLSEIRRIKQNDSLTTKIKLADTVHHVVYKIPSMETK